MTPQEIEHQNWKEKMRQEAADKEIQRLRKVSKKQSLKNMNLRKALYFQAFFFISLFSILLLKGMISFSESASNEEFNDINNKYSELLVKQNVLSDSLHIIQTKLNQITNKNLDDRDERGIRFRVQIGAYKEIDLSEFDVNLVSINQESYDSINQYTLGNFKNYEKASDFLEDVKKMGFDDSFIITTKNGKRFSLEKAN
ncbi:hypothetical protein E9993_03420 [Labilibacter sediminis]|nr:hypothetical protein E9993_03420 [Labilibacter sediminis]